MKPTVQIDQRDTHQLVPAGFADCGLSAVAQLTHDPDLMADMVELESATSNRLWCEAGMASGISPRELVFGIPEYRVINAPFCNPGPGGARFSSSQRGAWYAAVEVETSQAEIAYHRQRWLEETGWDQEDVTEYVDYLADFRAEFHDIRGQKVNAGYLSADNYKQSQALAAKLLKSGAAGIVYPSVRRSGGTCIACFRPVLVTNVRKGETFTFISQGEGGPISVQ
jgi:hypothetical protein